MNIAELPIANVWYYESEHFQNEFVLRFESDGFRYALLTSENEDRMVYPKTVFHVDENSDCPYCEGSMYCLILKKYPDELFQRLIEYPSIRLEWLYINHVCDEGRNSYEYKRS